VDDSLYTARDLARVFGIQESRLHYWVRTGVVAPSVKRGGRSYFSFHDVISIKAAKDLLDGGVSLQAVRKNLSALRGALGVDRPLLRMRVVSDGERLVVLGDDAAFEPLSGQVVMDFLVGSLSSRVAEVLELPQGGERSAPARSGYDWFREGCAREVDGDVAAAEEAYRRALERDPALAAAHNNLGRLAHAGGRRGEARDHFERALALDGEQPEARYNLANLLDELGEAARAVEEWSRVVALHPGFADAHFNLGVALAHRDEPTRARLHLERYLALAPDGESAAPARALLDGEPIDEPQSDSEPLRS
jgi:tetratricopeptide (TPR) repeat protein